MVPGLVAGHPSIPGWERDKVYQIGDLITAENGVWRLSNGTGVARNDWMPIWDDSAVQAAKGSQTIDEEVADRTEQGLSGAGANRCRSWDRPSRGLH